MPAKKPNILILWGDDIGAWQLGSALQAESLSIPCLSQCGMEGSRHGGLDTKLTQLNGSEHLDFLCLGHRHQKLIRSSTLFNSSTTGLGIGFGSRSVLGRHDRSDLRAQSTLAVTSRDGVSDLQDTAFNRTNFARGVYSPPRLPSLERLVGSGATDLPSHQSDSCRIAQLCIPSTLERSQSSALQPAFLP
jgi:hypothetical protein